MVTNYVNLRRGSSQNPIQPDLIMSLWSQKRQVLFMEIYAKKQRKPSGLWRFGNKICIAGRPKSWKSKLIFCLVDYEDKPI